MNVKRINRAVHKTRNFTQIENDTLRDTSLSYRALGILCESLSHKEEWEVTRDWLVKRRSEGRDAISTGMQELEKAGYSTFLCGRDDSGRIVSVGWCFHEVPVAEADRSNRTRWKTPTVRETRPDGDTARREPDRTGTQPVLDKRPSDQKTISQKTMFLERQTVSTKKQRAEPSRPSLSETIQYGATALNLEDAESERFFDYHEARGWIIGQTPVRDWRAKMKLWRTQNEMKPGAPTSTQAAECRL